MANRFKLVINYSEADNSPINSKSAKGWVDYLGMFLEKILNKYYDIETDVTLLSDKNTSASAMNMLPDALVCYVTDTFLKSESCVKEYNHYYNLLGQHTNAKIAQEERVFKVLNIGADPDGLPDTLKEKLAYNFYGTILSQAELDENESTDEVSIEYFGLSASPRYWVKLLDLVFDIYLLAQASLAGLSLKEVQSKGKTGRAVFLAETTEDLFVERDIIRRELIHHGFSVFPDQPLVHDYSILENTIPRDLDKCSMSIHLIGNHYLQGIKGTELSMVELQNNLSSRHIAKLAVKSDDELEESFFRVLWLAPNVELQDDRQIEFVTNLRRDAESMRSAEFLQIPIEELKSFVFHKFNKMVMPTTEQNTKAVAGSKSIYLICDQGDAEQSKPYAEYLKQKGYHVLNTLFEGDPIHLRYHHQSNLRRCDASLIFCNSASQNWVRFKLHDLLKAPGMGRSKPMLAKALVVTKKDFEFDEHFNLDETLIFNDQGFNAGNIDKFIAKMETAL